MSARTWEPTLFVLAVTTTELRTMWEARRMCQRLTMRNGSPTEPRTVEGVPAVRAIIKTFGAADANGTGGKTTIAVYALGDGLGTESATRRSITCRRPSAAVCGALGNSVRTVTVICVTRYENIRVFSETVAWFRTQALSTFRIPTDVHSFRSCCCHCHCFRKSTTILCNKPILGT